MTERASIHRWVPAEDDILRNYWPLGGINAVRDRLPGITPSAIRYRLAKLGVYVEAHKVIRRPSRPKGYEATTMDIAFWLATKLLSTRPSVPSCDRIVERWNVSIATAYRWRRWAHDKLDQIRAREGESHASR